MALVVGGTHDAVVMYRVSARPLVADAIRSLRSVLVRGASLCLGRCLDVSDQRDDVWWEITAEEGKCRLMVEAHDDFTLRTMDRLNYLTQTVLRQMGRPMVLVVAPWLSPRCRELIE